jgi:cell division protein FtsL
MYKIIIFLLITSNLFAFTVNLNMYRGRGCVWDNGHIVCRRPLNNNYTHRQCGVNQWGETVCVEYPRHKKNIDEVDNETDNKSKSEPFFKIN